MIRITVLSLTGKGVRFAECPLSKLHAVVSIAAEIRREKGVKLNAATFLLR